MHPTLTDLLGAVADDALWSQALSRYAASFGAEQIGWFALASGPDQLAQWGAEFAAHPDVDYWLQSPSADGTPALVGVGLTPQVTRRYAEYYRSQDPLWHAAMDGWARSGKNAQGGNWVVTDAPHQPTRGFRHTEVFNDFLRPNGIGTRMFGGNRGAQHPVGNLFASLYRQVDDEGFTYEQVQRFHVEFGAVQRAAFLHREMSALRTRTRGLEMLMERLPMGLMFFDTTGRLLHANARTHALAARREHAVLRALQRGLMMADAALRALFQRSLRGESGCMELPSGLLLVTLSIGDLTAFGLSHRTPGVVWVVMERALDSAAAVALARQAYRLSPAETALLLALLRGQTPQDFADTRGVRIRTVRTQISALLLKTGTQRQQDLVALVARLMLLAPGEAAEGLS